LIKKYLGNLKYLSKEHESFRELIGTRQTLHSNYMKKEQNLLLKKDTLFR